MMISSHGPPTYAAWLFLRLLASPHKTVAQESGTPALKTLAAGGKGVYPFEGHFR
jgi:hypothetical protein